GTKIAAGVVDADGHTRSFVVKPSRTELGVDAVLGDLFSLGRTAVEESGVDWRQIEAIGIGCGGPLDAEQGVLLAPPHLPGWHDVPVKELAEREYERGVTLENDATAAAAGEHRWGAGAGVDNMVYLTISTGVGGGVVIGGRRCRGCGRLGCLEAYVSGTSIAERAQEAGLAGATAERVAAAARDGDELAVRVWDETVEALSCGLISIVNLFEPQLVVLGGGVTRSGDQLLAPVREAVRAGAMQPAGDTVDVVISAFGDRVGVVGAAAIVFDGAAIGDALTNG